MLTYETPNPTNDPNKPTAFEAKGFPYAEILDPRRFEELIYCLYKEEIGSGDFSQFDGISLMSGTVDLGRDCVLIRENKNFGLIQCKRYKNNLSKDEVGMEVTKFALYSLIEPTLIYDLNNFTYFIASATGFANSCIAFLNDFNTNIVKEADLEKWISRLVKNPTLQRFEFEPPKSRVLEILSRIKIRMIEKNDLDKLMVQTRNFNIAQLFFKVMGLIDSDGVEKILESMSHILPRNFSEKNIVDQLTRGSLTVSAEKNQFEGIKESHIRRIHTEELLEWVMGSMEKADDGTLMNLCLLAGNAGVGKTVIMRDLYDELIKQDIGVLAIKADKVYATSYKDLQEQIGIDMGVFELIERCSKQFAKVVILIDQIDALSQSLSSSPEFLNFYKRFISAYQANENVKIVISVRVFDLHYDIGLRDYKDRKQIVVAALPLEETLAQLGKLGLTQTMISSSLLELLRIPNHLNVFSRIYKAGHSFSGMNSLQDLYGELYRIKISKPISRAVKAKNLIRLIKELVAKMYSLHHITVSELSFDQYAMELDYLKSELIIKVESNQIQFFHQTFYDYLFARDFITKKKSLIRFIAEGNQSIMMRAGLKMILNFTRETDPVYYENQIRMILKTRSVHFHLKHLMLTILSTELAPTENEKEIFSSLIIKDYDFLTTFCEHVSGIAWVQHLNKSDVFSVLKVKVPADHRYPFDDMMSILLKRNHRQKRITVLINILGFAIRRNLSGNEQVVMNILSDFQELNTVRWLLINNSDWKNKTAIALLEKCYEHTDVDRFGYYIILEKLAHADPDYVFERIKDNITILDTDRKSSFRSNRNHKILQTLLTKIPEKFLDHSISVILKEGMIYRLTPETDKLIKIGNVKGILTKDANFHETDDVYKLLATGLKTQAIEKTAYFRTFLDTYGHSRLDWVVNLLLFCFTGNEKGYVDDIIKLFGHLSFQKAFNSYDDINRVMRKTLTAAANYFTKRQFAEACEIILKITFSEETSRTKSKEPDQEFYITQVGYTKFSYLKCLPSEYLKKNRNVGGPYRELQRKFIDFNEMGSFRVYKNKPNRAKEIQYPRLRKGNWLNLFKKHDTIKATVQSVRGEQYEHAEKFAEVLKIDLNSRLDLIATIVADKNVPLIFTIKGLQAMEDAGLDISSYLKVVIQQNATGDDLYYTIELCNQFLKKDEVDRDFYNL